MPRGVGKHPGESGTARVKNRETSRSLEGQLGQMRLIEKDTPGVSAADVWSHHRWPVPGGM